MLGWRVALFVIRAALGSRGQADRGLQLGMLCVCVAVAALCCHPLPAQRRLQSCGENGEGRPRRRCVANQAVANRSFGWRWLRVGLLPARGTVCGQLATVEVSVRMLPVLVVVTPGWRRPMKPNRRKVPEWLPKPSRAPLG